MRGKLRIFGIILCVLAYSLLAFTGGYFLTNVLFAWMSIHSVELIRQLTASLFGSLIFGLTASLIGRLMRPKQMKMFRSMIDALREIAKGNFRVNVHIQHRHDSDDPFDQLARSINDAAAQLDAMEQMRQEFISNVSHEIQSPLTSINGFAHALLYNSSLSDGQRAHYLDIIETESIRLSKLSDNLLKLTSLESEHHPFEPRSYRVDRQLRKIILACEPQWSQKDLNLDVSLDEVSIIADEDLLSQVWVNLLHNSIKFTPDGGEIKVTLTRADKWVYVHVKDTGVGIATEAKEHIFERFYKADSSRNRSVGGSGLGLSIVKKIIDMHHGEIDVNSHLGEGTEFTVKLPQNALR